MDKYENSWMTKNYDIDYAKLIDDAMHQVVKNVLRQVSDNGLPGEHHFFITFKTDAEGVMISEELKEKYPEEMTIVIQHQFHDLEVDDNKFSIVLSFEHVKQNLTVPFSSLVSFVDPSVKFGLQFNSSILEEELEEASNETFGEDSRFDSESGTAELLGKGEESDGSNVVTLDSFRKKNKGNKDG